MIISGTVVAIAPNYEIFMIGRAFIGVSIGGFWSMSAATAIRLVRSDQVPRALAILNGGNALATVIAAPLGSFLGGLIGWRGAFFFVVPVAAVVFVWQLMSLPSMKPTSLNICEGWSLWIACRHPRSDGAHCLGTRPGWWQPVTDRCSSGTLGSLCNWRSCRLVDLDSAYDAG